METISYKLDQFEGPLDLLLTLISKNKIDISDIPIALLCDQYMEYINAEENRDIEIASEFLVMASELMLIKSRMLLPKQENDEDPRAALVEAMLEYKRAKTAAAEMSDLYSTFGARMVKEQDEIGVDKSFVADHDVELLRAALVKAMKESPVNDERERNKFTQFVAPPAVSVVEVATHLVSRLRRNGKLFLDEYFVSAGRSELIAKFMAILELFKSGYVTVSLEDAEEVDGVVTATSHISVRLSEEATDEALSDAFSGLTE